MIDSQTDEFSGQGGSYILENGKRKLVERTESPLESNPAPGEVQAQSNSAASETQPEKQGE